MDLGLEVSCRWLGTRQNDGYLESGEVLDDL